MISRTAFCSAHADTTCAWRFGPIPGSSTSRAGSFSMTSNTSAPNVRTSCPAKWGPMPRIIPEPRYFSMPSRVLGGTTRKCSARNWSPWLRSLTHAPSASTNSPGATLAALPTTVIGSRRREALTRSTQKPVSSL